MMWRQTSFTGPSYWIRDDGAIVSRTETKTGKRPWRGSHWNRGQWVRNAGSFNTATAQAAMDGIDFHWPKWMGVKK